MGIAPLPPGRPSSEPDVVTACIPPFQRQLFGALMVSHQDQDDKKSGWGWSR
jgi:hypothetical protein